ncbi:ion transporter [Candidatus Saccharibacteria bacterium]|nr:ion transporter [Candidatus Saccharibacteria bacterium]
MKQNKRLKEFLYAKECLILTLAALSLVFLAIEQLGYLSTAQLRALDVFDVTVGLIFIGEFVLELELTTNKRGYVKSNWFYLLAAIPLPYTFAQLLRGLRIIRVIKLIRVGTHLEYEKSLKK